MAYSNLRWCVVRRYHHVWKIPYFTLRDPTGFSAGGGNGNGGFDVGNRVKNTPYFSVGSLIRKTPCETFPPDAKSAAVVATAGSTPRRTLNGQYNIIRTLRHLRTTRHRGLPIAASSNVAIAYTTTLTGSSERTTEYGRIASRCDGRCRCRAEGVRCSYVGHAADGDIDVGLTADGYI